MAISEEKVWTMLQCGDGCGLPVIQKIVAKGIKKTVVEESKFKFGDPQGLKGLRDESLWRYTYEHATGEELKAIVREVLAVFPRTQKFAGGLSRAGYTKAVLERFLAQ